MLFRSRYVQRLVAPVVGLMLGACAAPSEQVNQQDHSESIARVFAGLRSDIAVRGRPAPPTYSLESRMAEHNVPGVSVAVVDGGRLAWARSFGVKARGSADPVEVATLFQAASISKPITATATLKMVEGGKLDLDTPVNEYLTSWRLPANALTAQEPVTLRHLLSHGAGTTVWGFPGYEVSDRLPTVPQILDGVPPANTPAVRVDLVPGQAWRYSGGGVTIEQLVIADVAGEPFSDVLDELVLGPFGMGLSTFAQPLPTERHHEAATGHRADGSTIPGRWHVYPELAAAGLWTTPSDLMTWAIEIAAAYRGASDAKLSEGLAREMLTVQQGAQGLGPSLGGSGEGFFFGHGGANAGFQSQLVYFPETGQGAAVMTNSDRGGRLNREILIALGQEYGWPNYSEVVPFAEGEAALARYSGTFAASQLPVTLTLAPEDGTLFVDGVGALGHQEVVILSPDRGITLGTGTEIVFVRDSTGELSALESMGLVLHRRE